MLDQLARRVFATPQSRDFRTGEGHRWDNPDRSRNLNDQCAATGSGGQLNPGWVEWLLGWPIGWTSLEPITELLWLDWSVDPADDGSIPRVATGIAKRIDRLKAIGNGQVPQVAAMAWEILSQKANKGNEDGHSV